MLKRLLALLCLLVLSSCASVPDGARPSAWLRPGVRVFLPQPGLTPAVQAHQLLTSRYRGREHALTVVLDADARRLSLVGLSMVGIRLFTLQYDAHGLQARQHVAAPGLPPAAQVLSDIMLSYWPVAAWQAVLPTGWQLVDAGLQRRLLDERGEIVTRIDYDAAPGGRRPVQVQQRAFGYDIHIQNLDD
ncbi:DUF3261 domain-containing protein [Castellaniella caeni]|uniref:DUF3261 domain-containing protein n=1 Tax=Castellaniella caeni TaxID=266123 RepID=UPI00082C5C9D|nr:DUF3261 domain-containing protein [Castellaniella caeni]